MQTDLIIAPLLEAARISNASSLAPWSSLDLGPVGIVELEQLIAHRLNLSFKVVLDSMPDINPEAVEFDENDMSTWKPVVMHVPNEYVTALAAIPDGELVSVANWWWSTEEFAIYRQLRSNFDESVLAEILTSIRDFMRSTEGQAVLVKVTT